MIRTAVVATLVLAIATCAQAGLVYSWEGTNDGWDFSDVTVVSNTATTGVTAGSYSVELLIPSQVAWGMEQLKHDWFPTGFITDGLTVSVDVTTSSDNLWVRLFQQGGPPWYPGDEPTPWTVCSSPGGLKTTTVSYDYPMPQGGVLPTGWGDHRIILRGDGSGDVLPARTVWIDNYQVTPEPATMVLLGLGGLGMLLRRRRS